MWAPFIDMDYFQLQDGSVITYPVKYEISLPFPNLNGCSVEFGNK